jgi:uncharacterized protein
MHVQTLTLLAATPGTQQHLQVLHFGTPGRGPKATIQAALHADEIPPLLVAQALRRSLGELEARGRLTGHVQLLPWANPIGLAQRTLGLHQGRFAFDDGVNFNRLHPDLSEAVCRAVEGRLGSDEAANTVTIRQALRDAAAALPAHSPAEDLKRQLARLAVDSDIVLDLHCDSEAAMHLYALTPQAALADELGALLGASAVLLATESGDSPFDEACSRPWHVLRERFPQHPIPLGCFSPTIELRGQADTSHELAEADATALIEFLRRRGIVAGAVAPLPEPRCHSTPLASSEPIVAPHAGVLVFHAAPGDTLAAGARVADLVDIDSGAVTPLRCQGAGVLYARIATRWAQAQDKVAKVAGTTLVRTGKLLSAR